MFGLFDIGGTKTRLAYSPDGEIFESPLSFPTPPSFEKGSAALIEGMQKAMQGRPLKSMVLGLPGPIDRERGMLFEAPHLPDWKGKPLVKLLAVALGTAVFLENDTALAALGEATAGAGRKAHIVAYIAIGTGVGGARIVDKKIDAARFGFEPGHQMVRFPTTKPYARGYLEEYISGAALLAQMNKPPREIQEKELWDEVTLVLAAALNNTLVYWSPDIIVLGGSIAQHKISVARVEEHLREFCTIFPTLPPVLLSALRDDAALYGGLAFLKQQAEIARETTAR